MRSRTDTAANSQDRHADSRSGTDFSRLLSPVVMALLAFVVAFAALLAHFSQQGGIGRSWQMSYAPAIFMACTGTFGIPEAPAVGAAAPEWAKVLDEFLNDRSDAFDCSSIPEDLKVGWFASLGETYEPSLIVLQYSHLGHLMLTGLVWKLTGVSWWAVAWIGAFYAGAAFAALVLIFCRFVSPPAALAYTLLPLLDPQTFHLAGRLRDFGKIPAIFVAILLLLLVASAASTRSLMRRLALLGLVVGIGVTLRSEMVLYGAGILALAALLLAGRRPALPVATVLIGLTICTAIVLAFYVPASMAYRERPSYMTHALVLGMEDQRLKETHLGVRSFSVMPIFSDQGVYRNAQLVHATISDDPVSYQTDEYGERTDAVFRRMIGDAPYYGLVRIAGAAYDFFAGPWGLSPNTTGAQWLRAGMCVSALVALLALWRRNAALGFAVTGIIAMGAAITSLDYEWRHVRHMKWLIFPLTLAGPVVLACAVLGRFGNGLPSRLLRRLNRVPEGASSSLLASLTLLGLLIYAVSVAGAAWAQSRSVNALRAELMDLETEPLQIERSRSGDGMEVVRFPGETAPFLLRLDFDLAGCRKHAISIQYRYRGKIDPTHGKETLVSMVRRQDGQEHYFFTVHDDLFTVFDGIAMDGDDARCLVAAYRAGAPEEPFLYHMLIDGRWQPLGSFRF